MTNTPAESITFYTLGCTQIELPMPARLTEEEAIREAREIQECSFTTEAGRMQYRDFVARGYHLISWPDGVRAAVRKPDGQHLTKLAGAMVYREARLETERRIAAVLDHQGEA